MKSSIYHRTLNNAAILSGGAALEMGLQFAFVLIAGRQLGPAEFGYYGYLLSILTLVLVIAHFGLQVVMVREIARPAPPGVQRQRDTAIFAATFRIRGGFSWLALLVALAVAALAPLNPVHRWAATLMFAYLLFVPFDLSPLLDAYKLSRWDVPGRLAGRTVGLLAVIVFWQTHNLNVANVALASTLAMLVNVAIGWIVGHHLKLPLRPLAPTAETARLLRICAPITWATLMTTVYLYSQTMLVQWLSVELQTGYYALANRLFSPVLLFKGIIYRLLLPLLSEAGTDRAAFTARLERVIPVFALLFMPLSALGIPAIGIVLVPFFGAEYAGAVLPLQILLSHVFITGVGSICGSALFALGFQRAYTVSLTVACVVAIGSGWLLIPPYGAVGAAWSAWLAEMVSLAILLPAFLRQLRPRVVPRLLRIGLSSAAGPGLFYLLRPLLPDLLSFTAALLAILLGLWLTGEISRERLQALRSLSPASPDSNPTR